MTITPCKRDDLGTLDGLLKDVVAAQFAFGRELLHLARDACHGVGSRKRKSSSCCDIPEACWMPKPLGEVHCRVKTGDTGRVNLIVTNNDYLPHVVTAQSTGQNAGLVAFAPNNVALGPKERTTIVAQFTAPNQPGRYEMLLWVTVCSDHYLRWTVEVGEKCGDPCCYEVTIDDTPDHVVHWYDHFYCAKPCMGTHGKKA